MKYASLVVGLTMAVELATVSATTAFGAEPLSKFFNHPFDAMLISRDAQGVISTTHTISDGKGHMRTETTMPGNDLISIYDHDTSSLATIREKDKVVIKSRIPPYIMEPDNIPKTGLKSLGMQTINGHPCKGEAYHFANADFEVWRGTDVDDYTVKSIATRAGAKTVTELRSYKVVIPDESIFVIPTRGYLMQTSGH